MARKSQLPIDQRRISFYSTSESSSEQELKEQNRILVKRISNYLTKVSVLEQENRELRMKLNMREKFGDMMSEFEGFMKENHTVMMDRWNQLRTELEVDEKLNKEPLFMKYSSSTDGNQVSSIIEQGKDEEKRVIESDRSISTGNCVIENDRSISTGNLNITNSSTNVISETTNTIEKSKRNSLSSIEVPKRPSKPSRSIRFQDEVVEDPKNQETSKRSDQQVKNAQQMLVTLKLPTVNRTKPKPVVVFQDGSDSPPPLSDENNNGRRSSRVKREVNYKPLSMRAKMRRESIKMLDAVGENVLINYSVKQQKRRKLESNEPTNEAANSERKPLTNLTNSQNKPKFINKKRQTMDPFIDDNANDSSIFEFRNTSKRNDRRYTNI